ncbi:uncharacterized protein B0T15DRAFT_531572 [Chaetomium strumarium]|uniref:Ecp2 effector protein-like domain-containing protein n=1 Tax=Chaetomium strumarium TaxID=1170767 RepID=A0AAJ0GSB2_9PEZI|nr:hypothetical protein B0T15DRAFT_531572 [Chaetomium strumarium]
MPSLTRTLLRLLLTLSLTPTTLAAPTTPSSLTTRNLLSHRAVVFTQASSSSPDGTYIKDDYCGEAKPSYTTTTTTSSSSSPLAADCVALYNANPGPGYWTISTAAKGGEDGWVRLGQSGSCAFEVRWNENGEGVGEYKFGTNDLRFYIRAYVERAPQGQVVEGRVGVSSTVWCDTGRGMGFVDWRVVLA